MKKFNLKSKKNKIYIILIAIFILILSSVSIATFARQKNRNPLNIDNTWDGSISSSYRSGSGSQDDPFIISNASELAYFSNMLKTTSYSNTYFELSNDIIINKGTFKYEDNLIKYILDGNTYFVDKYSSNYYSSSDMINKVGSINLFDSINNFKGTFNGNSHTIYGAYITKKDTKYLGLFTNLNGTVKDLYVQNSLIYGGNITGGIASNVDNGLIENTIYGGYVIGSDNNTYEENEISLDDILLSKDSTSSNIDLSNINLSYYDIESITLEGVIDNFSSLSSISINNNSIDSSNFSINVDSSARNLSILYKLNMIEDIKITNLKYKVKYKLGISSGIASEASNTNILNTINKAYVYGYNYSSGIVSLGREKININNSYNTGSINSKMIASGIISYLNNASGLISNTYNAGEISAENSSGIIGNINNTNNFSIKNTFNATDSYFILNILSSSISITNSYSSSNKYALSGNYTGKITYTSNLKNKNFLINTLGFSEFTDLDNIKNNTNSVWVYEDDSYPILYTDDINKPLASININSYSWNNVSYSLNEVLVSNDITFNIKEDDNLNKVKEIYYYIKKDKNALSYDELNNITDWQLFTSSKKISEEGYYIIYAKIVDYNDNITYINSDILVLDLSGCDIEISYDNKTLNTLNDNPSAYFINDNLDIFVNAKDKMSGVKSIKYYVSEEVLNKEKLDLIDDSLWTNYKDKITINNKSSIIYIKALDNIGIASYASSDLILYEGYKCEGLYILNNYDESYDKLNITSNSSILLKYTYKSDYKFNDNDTFYLKSNKILPVNTKITLNLNNSMYTYNVKEDDYLLKDSYYLYSFDLFSLIGKSSKEVFKKDVTKNVDDTYKITVDFSHCNIDEEISGLILSVSVLDNKKNEVRGSLKNSLKEINIYNNMTSNAQIKSNYSDEVMYNSNSENNIDINLSKVYSYMNKNKIIDSNLLNMVWGLKIKVLDLNKNIVDHKYLKNIKFMIDDNKYSMNKDVININLSNSSDTLNKVLNIITKVDNSILDEGKYYFDIEAYLSFDGVLDNILSIDSINIPLNVTNKKNTDNYSFDIQGSNEKIIKKTLDNYSMNYNILYKGKLSNPKIYVSLLKKSVLSALDVSYKQININDYTSDNLTLYKDNMYLLVDNKNDFNNKITINLKPNSLDYNLYKLRFYLYDNDKMISFADKAFITK